MEFQTIQFRQDGPVGVLTLNRPECLNAVNHVMRDELRAFWTARMNDYKTRVIVVTGAGRGFCAGLDMKDPVLISPEHNTYTPKTSYEAQTLFSDIILFMRRCPQPVIGAINGAAAGAGFSFSLACDVRLAATSAKFSAAYINIGVGGADMGCSWLLPRLVGTGNAARYMMTGELIQSEEALRTGLVQSVHEQDTLMDQAMLLARTMVSKSPLGLRLTKEALDQNTSGVSLEEAIKLEDRNQAMCIAELRAK